MITTSADSLAAVDPRAPIATPTSAAASTGASLTPSPDHQQRPVLRLLDGGHLLLRQAFGPHLVDAELGRDMVRGCLGITGQDHGLADTKVPESGQGGTCVVA